MIHLTYKEPLIQHIMRLLNKMKTSYPGLYRYLDENSLSAYQKNDHNISSPDLEAYMVTLEEQMKNYTEIVS
jgi:hypothetical protein